MASEWQTDGEMEGQVTTQVWVYQRIMGFFLRLIGRIDGLHAEVEAQDEVVEVQPETESVTDCQILDHIMDLKLSARLLRIVAQCPNISCISKNSSVEFPEQTGTIFQIDIQLQVTGLGDEIDAPVFILVSTRPQTSDTPASHAVCATREIALLKWLYLTVSIRIGDANTKMKDQLVACSFQDISCKIEIRLYILRIGNVKDLILSEVIHLTTEKL